jgi:hypothetical protein
MLLHRATKLTRSWARTSEGTLVIGQVFVGPVHQVLQMSFGGFAGLHHEILLGLSLIVE